MLRQFTKRVLETVLPSRVLLTHGASKPVASGCAISLTFDDGPHPENTPRLLDNLAAFDLKATFFIVGELAVQHPQLVRRMAEAGHEIGNHTWTHSEPRQTSARQFIDEVRRTRTWIEDTTGKRCHLMRPPKGELTPAKLCHLWREQQTVVLWNQDPRDYRMESWCDMEDWCRAFQPAHGDIVLMHDKHPHAATAAVLFGSLPMLNGIHCVPISHWLTTPHSVPSAAENAPPSGLKHV